MHCACSAVSQLILEEIHELGIPQERMVMMVVINGECLRLMVMTMAMLMMLI